MNQRFQNALQGVAQRVPPIWFMRQAGRYHAHYQKLRSSHSFWDLCTVPELACEVTLGPVEDFDFDLAILFSDLLFPLDALGLGLSYGDSGPKLENHLRDRSALAKLASVEAAAPKLEFQRLALKAIRERLAPEKSLIGFVGGPWTLFAYAVEGQHGKGLVASKQALSLFDDFCSKLIPLLKENIKLQLEGGAEVVMLFDTAAGELAPGLFARRVWPKLQDLFSAFPKKLGYYSYGTQPSHFIECGVQHCGAAGFGVDHRWRLFEALDIFSGGFIQGNFDQALLLLTPDNFKVELEAWLAPLRELTPDERRGWICGLGHGVLPGTPEENVRYFVQRVREVLA